MPWFVRSVLGAEPPTGRASNMLLCCNYHLRGDLGCSTTSFCYAQASGSTRSPVRVPRYAAMGMGTYSGTWLCPPCSLTWTVAWWPPSPSEGTYRGTAATQSPDTLVAQASRPNPRGRLKLLRGHLIAIATPTYMTQTKLFSPVSRVSGLVSKNSGEPEVSS